MAPPADADLADADPADADADADSGGYRHYNNPEDTVFTLPLFGHELSFAQQPADRTLGHGSVVWEAAVIFCKWTELSSDFSVANMSGKRVLELGSGTAVAGVALLMRGARVVFSDLSPVCAAITLPNATSSYRRLQGLSLPVPRLYAPAVLPVDWTIEGNLRDLVWPGEEGGVAGEGTRSSDDKGEGEGEGESAERSKPAASPADIVLLTDCVFSESLIPALVRTVLDAVRGNRHAVVYAVHEVRNEDANALFVATMRRHFRDVKLVPRRQQAEGFRHELVQILVAKRRKA